MGRLTLRTLLVVAFAGTLVGFIRGQVETETTRLIAYGTPTADYRKVGGYLLSYDGRTRSARWVLERLTRESLVVNVMRDTESFRVDRDAPPECRTDSDDYRGSGYDIGHLAAAANHRRSQADLEATFIYSNAAPQAPSLNRGAWRRLEDHVRMLADQESPVWVVTCPLWIPSEGRLTCEVIGDGVWVPTHFGKAVLCETAGAPKLFAWIMPNEECNGSLDDYRVSVDEFERAAGLDLWAVLDDSLERRLEAER